MKLSRLLPQLELKYKPECQNMAADASSRMPVKNCDVCIVSTCDEENEVLIRIQPEQQKDGKLFQIINYLKGKAYHKRQPKLRR